MSGIHHHSVFVRNPNISTDRLVGRRSMMYTMVWISSVRIPTSLIEHAYGKHVTSIGYDWTSVAFRSHEIKHALVLT